eukprot:5061604-Pyramimonas_sp.AAC.1
MHVGFPALRQRDFLGGSAISVALTRAGSKKIWGARNPPAVGTAAAGDVRMKEERTHTQDSQLQRERAHENQQRAVLTQPLDMGEMT